MYQVQNYPFTSTVTTDGCEYGHNYVIYLLNGMDKYDVPYNPVAAYL